MLKLFSFIIDLMMTVLLLVLLVVGIYFTGDILNKSTPDKIKKVIEVINNPCERC